MLHQKQSQPNQLYLSVKSRNIAMVHKYVDRKKSFQQKTVELIAAQESTDSPVFTKFKL